MKYKCPICGCEEHVELASIGLPYYTIKNYSGPADEMIDREMTEMKNFLTFAFDISSPDGHTEIYYHAGFKTFMCKNCGHLDLFKSEENLKKMKQVNADNKAAIDDCSKQIDKSEKEIKAREDKINKNLSIIMEIEKKLLDENITVKQQKDLLNKKVKIENDILCLKSELFGINNQLADLKAKFLELGNEVVFTFNKD